MIPIISSRIADPLGYEFNSRMSPPWPNKRWSILKFFVNNFFEVFNQLTLYLGLRGSISVVLFTVVGTDLYFNRTVSTNTVIVIIVAVVALYLEYMIINAEEIEFFKIFRYKAKPPQQPNLPPPSTSPSYSPSPSPSPSL